MFKNSEGKAARIKDKVVAGGKAVGSKINDAFGDAGRKIAKRAMKDAIKGALAEANRLVEEDENREKKA